MSAEETERFIATLQRARSGSSPDFERIVLPHLPLLLSLALGTLGHRDQAEDAVQEALIRFLRKIPPLQGPREARAYLCRLTLNEARRLRRSRWLRAVREADPPGRDPEATAPSPEAHAHHLAIYERVLSLLPHLTRREREVFSLRGLHEMDYADIAEVLSISPVTARRLYSLARDRLRRLLADGGLHLDLPD